MPRYNDKNAPKVLIIEDQESWQERLFSFFRANGYTPIIAPDIDTAIAHLEKYSFEVVTIDRQLEEHPTDSFDQMSGDIILDHIKCKYPHITSLMVTASQITIDEFQEIQHLYDLDYFVSKIGLNSIKLKLALERANENKLKRIGQDNLSPPVHIEDLPERPAGKSSHPAHKALTNMMVTILCYDHFPQVYKRFRPDTNKTNKINRLLDYCEDQNQTAELLELIKRYAVRRQ